MKQISNWTLDASNMCHLKHGLLWGVLTLVGTSERIIILWYFNIAMKNPLLFISKSWNYMAPGFHGYVQMTPLPSDRFRSRPPHKPRAGNWGRWPPEKRDWLNKNAWDQLEEWGCSPPTVKFLQKKSNKHIVGTCEAGQNDKARDFQVHHAENPTKAHP